MKRLAAAAALTLTVLTFNTVTAQEQVEPTPVHVHPDTPLPEGVVIVEVVDFDELVTPAEAAVLRPDLFPTPDLATSCIISPNRGSYAKASCGGYNGKGSRGFQLQGTAWNGCNKYVTVYGSTGSAPTRSSYIPSSGPGTFLPFPWTLVITWIYKY